MKFFSQVGQDQFVLEHFFRGKRNGVFVDIGAYDGEKFSNSLFFERYMGWSGLCVEPLPSAYAKLTKTRKAICEPLCVADFEGETDFVEADAGVDEKMLSGLPSQFDPRHVERLKAVASKRVTREVQVTTLAALLAKHSLFHVDFCSIDAVGAELSILGGLDPDRFHISVFTVENKYDDPRLPELMASKGYELVGKLEQDYVFRRRDVQPLPRTSVFCAVWHGDANRHALLRGHAENLARQTVPVEPIYVFDGGDAPPQDIPGKVICVREPLTLYQAWNVALSLVSTPYVMNLNLDDRLAPDAVQQLQSVIERENAMVVGGDWKICYSQRDTDEVQACYPASQLPFVPQWPPAPGTATRLGSGTGERGTYGPATLWRMQAHVGAPRYPWRLGEGTMIRSAGDAGWWTILGQHFKHKMVKLPLVIGNYYSHPSEQAEFRPLPYNELDLMKDIGISLL